MTRRVPAALAAASVLLAVTLLAVTLSGCSLLGGDAGGREGTADVPVDADLAAIVDDDSIDILAIYAVDGDDLLGDPDPESVKAWGRFTELFPADTHPEIVAFVAIDAEKSDETVGVMQTSALNPDERYLALDVTGYESDDDVVLTMIHEFGHLLTLRSTELDTDVDATSCPVFADDEGCPLAGTYMYDWDEQFWPGVTYDDLDDSEDATAARYATDDFLTEYAATSPFEDIAETFSLWVMADPNEPIGDGVVGEKLRFFDDYPDAVAIKDHVREALGI